MGREGCVSIRSIIRVALGSVDDSSEAGCEIFVDDGDN